MRFKRAIALAAVSSLALLGWVVSLPPAQAAGVSVAEGYSLTRMQTGINRPHALRFAPDGRLFLLEQTGRVRIVKQGSMSTSLTIDPADIVEPGGSAGLLSIAFPPTFKTDAVQWVYLVYTHSPMPGFNYPHNVLSRFVINGDVIDPSSEQLLVHFDTLVGGDGTVKTMHYGGDMEFGADGELYVSTGDLLIGPNAQNLQNLYGKILRYNPNGTIPTDNPYYNTLTGRLRAIWSNGLRNPFKLAYDKVTGDILIGDVGSSTWEEVNQLPAGEPAVNFGWSTTEGYTSDPRFRTPLLAYPHDPDLAGPGEPFGCAVMGGDVYRPKTKTFPSSYNGDTFFADHCQGWLRSIDPATGDVGPVLVTGLELPVDSAVAPNGAVWIIQRQLNGLNNGVLYRLQYNGLTDVAPTISGDPRDLTVAAGMDATFDAFASGTEPLTYQWFKDGLAIDGATSSSYIAPSVQLTDDGAQYSVRVTNTFGSDTSQAALLTVLDDTPPDTSITSPDASLKFKGGSSIVMSATATDAEDGVLPASAFEWSVDLHHNTHTHPEFGPVTGTKAVTYDVPTLFETDPDIFLRIQLRVTDSDGVTTEVTRDVLPKYVTMRLETVPGGRSLILDGSPVATPLDLLGVVGLSRTLTAPSTTVDGVNMVFDSWENGSTNPSRGFRAPATAHTYRTFYRVNDGVVGAGSGLLGHYFDSEDFTGLSKDRVDRVPYFTWGKQRPLRGISRDHFSIRWTGQVSSQFSELYTFDAASLGDDQMRVVVDGVTVVNTFNNGSMETGDLALTAGQQVPITIEFADGTKAANAPLTWSSSSTPASAIPGSQLFAN